jgi:O-antigen ligase
MLLKSIETTIKNPIFGIGPGQFATYLGFAEKNKGRSGYFAETHNAYTQISAETGFPGIIFFLGAWITAFAGVLKRMKEARALGHREIEQVGIAILVSFVAFGTSGFFLSMGFRFYFYLQMGLAIAYIASAGRELHKIASAAQAPPVARPFWSALPWTAAAGKPGV